MDYGTALREVAAAEAGLYAEATEAHMEEAGGGGVAAAK